MLASDEVILSIQDLMGGFSRCPYMNPDYLNPQNNFEAPLCISAELITGNV
jgi:hypothetical protein